MSSYQMTLIWIFMAKNFNQEHVVGARTTYLKKHFQTRVCPNLASETTVCGVI